MRPEKKSITAEYLERLQRSPFFVVADYTGLRVPHFNELRKRLRGCSAEMHVVKNTIFKAAAREAGIEDLGAPLTGQLAVVTGTRDVSAAAKILKTFATEFEKPKLRFGYADRQHLDTTALLALADLPAIEVLRARLLGVLQAPAGQLVRLLNEPAAQLARILQAKAKESA
jgi:large subunit ribosomal protein L10